MGRLASWFAVLAPATLCLWASIGWGQEPTSAAGTVVAGATEAAPGATVPAPASIPGPAAIGTPRTDLYSNYSDAFMNPAAIAASGCETSGEMGKLFAGPRHFKIVFAYDQLRWGRTHGDNQPLTRTTSNIFDQGNGLGPAVTGDPNENTLYGFPIGNAPTQGGLITVGDPNTPGVAEVVLPGENPNITNFLGQPNRPIGETLIPEADRMQSDQFGFGRENGYRPRIGLEFEDGSRLMLTYFRVDTFESRLIEDVSGSAFFTRVISDDNSPFIPQYQRFGYLNSRFTTGDPFFAGERRRQVGDDPSLDPHSPQKESPALRPTAQYPTTSSDVPREPTVNDAARQNTPNGPEDQRVRSLLWTDGEVAIADYHFNIQGGDLTFEKSLFEWFNPVWKIWGTAGVKYLSVNEGFRFIFADVAPTGSIGGSGYQARSPFDRFAANNVGATPDTINYKAQPSIETVATTTVDVKNNIVAPEIGLHAIRPIWGWFEIDLAGKGAWGANFMERDSSLVRGDGLVGFSRQRQEMLSSGTVQFQLGMNVVPHPNVRLRAGWEALILCNVGTGTSNISFDLDRDIRPKNNETVSYFGWYFGGDVKF
jgi:hypothetical protein